MKATGWIAGGCAVLAIVLLLISHNRYPEQSPEVLHKVLPIRTEQTRRTGSDSSQAKPPAPAVSAAAETIIDPATGYEERLGAMSQLGYEIPPTEIEVFKEFLAGDIPEDVKIPRGAYNAVRNDLYEVLLRQKNMPEGLGDLLVDVFNDPEQDGMWRNYCIQFMAAFYERAAAERAEGRRTEVGGQNIELRTSNIEHSTLNIEHRWGEELDAVRESLWAALAERDNSNAATALLGLRKLTGNYPEFDKAEVEAAALDLASDGHASVANRITAIRICAEQGNAEALAVARSLAEDGNTTMLRCAAIASLGDLGSEDDLALLQAYATSEDERIQRIAITTLQKLEAK